MAILTKRYKNYSSLSSLAKSRVDSANAAKGKSISSDGTITRTKKSSSSKTNNSNTPNQTPQPVQGAKPNAFKNISTSSIAKPATSALKQAAFYGGVVVPAVSFGLTTPVGQGLAKTAAVGVGTYKTVEAVSLKKPSLTPFQKELLSNKPLIKEAQAAGRAKDIEGENDFVRGFKDLLILTREGKKDTKQFQEGARDFYSSKGYKGFELEQAVELSTKVRKAKAGGETAALLAVSTFSEGLGQKFVTTKAATTPVITGKFKTFKTGVIIGQEISKAGLAEGVATDLVLQQSRDLEPNLKRTFATGALGAASAGLIGGAIGATAGTTKSKVLLGAAYVTDPYELPGDILEGSIRKGASKVTRIPVITPTITKTPTYTIISTTTNTKSSKGKTAIKVPNVINTPTSIANNINVPTNINTRTPVSTSSNVATSIFVPTSTTISTPTTITTPSNVPIFVPISTPISTPITTVVPTLKFPIIPPVLPSGGGGGGIFSFGRRGSRSTAYIPSLLGLRQKPKKLKKGFLTGLEVRPILK